MRFNVYDREKLYEEVWKEPMIVVSKRYGISNVYLKKMCVKLQIPTPGSGYWTIVKSGGQAERPPLPKLSSAKRKTSDAIETPTAENPLYFKDDPSSRIAIMYTRLNKIEAAYTYILSKNYVHYHGLVSETAKWFKLTTHTSSKYHHNNILDIRVTEELINRSLKIMDTVIRVLERLGATVIWEDGSTYANIENEKIKIHIEDIFNKQINCDVLLLKIDDSHAGRRSWSDTGSKPIDEIICSFIHELYNTADAIKLSRNNEHEHREWLIKKDYEMARFKKLEEAAIDWYRSQNIESYIKAIEQYIGSNMDKLFDHFEWLEWAKGKAEWLNPLMGRYDPILGKKHETLFDDEE